MYAKLSKCTFAQTSLEYLGHIISDKGVATDPEKTRAMQLWPTPTNFTELRGFLGLTGYYRKFVKNYGLLAKPMSDLLKKKVFEWSSAANEAFLALKQAMSTTPVLAVPNFHKPFEVETDACDTGLGAVLSQQGQPVAYFSKALSVNNQKLSAYEKEFMAIMMAVDKWRPYLSRGPFVIKADHKSLSHLDDQVLSTDLQKKAMAKLIGLQFKFQYKKGVDNKAADALSRVARNFELQALSTCHPTWLQEVVNSYASDAKAQELLNQLAISSPNETGFSLEGGLIRKKGRIWIGDNVALQTKIIHALHNFAVGGHSGTQATYHRIKKSFYWTGLKAAITSFVQQCSVCQHAKHEHCKSPGLLYGLCRRFTKV